MPCQKTDMTPLINGCLIQKIIPFSSLGKQNGMLVGIKAEEIQINTEDDNKKSNNIIVGIYDKSLTKRGEYRALVGIDMI